MLSLIEHFECIDHYEGREHALVILGMAVAERDNDLSNFLFDMSASHTELSLCKCLVDSDLVLFDINEFGCAA